MTYLLSLVLSCITFINTMVFMTLLNIIEGHQAGILHWTLAVACIVIYSSIITYLMVKISTEEKEHYYGTSY
jgi:hypothetical protein